jgi:hypothetical protein
MTLKSAAVAIYLHAEPEIFCERNRLAKPESQMFMPRQLPTQSTDLSPSYHLFRSSQAA